MYKEILRNTEGIGLLPSLSFLIFFIFFLVLLIYVVKMSKSHRNQMKNIPLDEEQ